MAGIGFGRGYALAHSSPFPYRLRDGVHSAIILEFALIIALFAVVLWIRFRKLTDERGNVRCPHCTLRYDAEV